MKMELIEGSETSAIITVTPGNYPKENTLHIEHGESLKSRKLCITRIIFIIEFFIKYMVLLHKNPNRKPIFVLIY